MFNPLKPWHTPLATCWHTNDIWWSPAAWILKFSFAEPKDSWRRINQLPASYASIGATGIWVKVGSATWFEMGFSIVTIVHIFILHTHILIHTRNSLYSNLLLQYRFIPLIWVLPPCLGNVRGMVHSEWLHGLMHLAALKGLDSNFCQQTGQTGAPPKKSRKTFAL